ncbi:hypothetical protein ODU25_04340, partial [Streptococcus suis]|uniref:hypothetical protein n=1 Tax=Streptococcus suis TaxID=1307 RepID=UPI0037D102A1
LFLDTFHFLSVRLFLLDKGLYISVIYTLRKSKSVDVDLVLQSALISPTLNSPFTVQAIPETRKPLAAVDANLVPLISNL